MKFCGHCLSSVIPSSAVKCMKCNDIWHKSCAMQPGLHIRLTENLQDNWFCSMCVSANELAFANEALLKIISHQSEMHMNCAQLNEKLNNLEKKLGEISDSLNDATGLVCSKFVHTQKKEEHS